MKAIARIVCGQCTPNKRHLMGSIVDTPDGPALRARHEHVPLGGRSFARRERWDYDDILFDDLDREELKAPGDPRLARLGCPQHGWIAVTVPRLQQLTDDYRTTGRPVLWVVEHPR